MLCYVESQTSRYTVYIGCDCLSANSVLSVVVSAMELITTGSVRASNIAIRVRADEKSRGSSGREWGWRPLGVESVPSSPKKNFGIFKFKMLGLMHVYCKKTILMVRNRDRKGTQSNPWGLKMQRVRGLKI